MTKSSKYRAREPVLLIRAFLLSAFGPRTSDFRLILACICLALHSGGSALWAARPQFDLTGTWEFYPNVGDLPLESVTAKPARIVVPGAWQTQGFGTPGGTMPAALLGTDPSPADHLRHNLTARCLYARHFEIPESWKNQHIFLVVRRVYARADVTLNGQRIGEHDGFSSPFELGVLITRGLKHDRHAALMRQGHCAVLLLGTGGFKETRAGYFLNQYGSGFGGIIEDHPAFATIPHEGRLHLGLYQLIAGGGLLEAESMPAPLREGAVVWGLRFTAWVSPVKDLHKVLHWSEAITENRFHLVLCNLDLLSDKPESQYVLGRTIDYLLTGRPCALARPCNADDLRPLLR